MLEGFDFFKAITGVGKDIADTATSVGDSVGNEVEKSSTKSCRRWAKNC